MAVFKKQGVYWIDYYVKGRRKRERIGPDKKLAETVLKKRKVAIAEGKYLEKQRPVTTTFDELAAPYLRYAQANKRSWLRDAVSLRILGEVFSGQRLTDMTPDAIERYKGWRLASISARGGPPRPATINRELACLKHMFTLAHKGVLHLPGGVPAENPLRAIKLLEEQNIRDRVLNAEEFQRLVDVSPDYFKPVLLCAYHTGMRKGEILRLTWDRVDLKAGFIRLRDTDTKNATGRSIPIGRELREVLQRLPIVLDAQGARVPAVFTRHGQPLKTVWEPFTRACRQLGLKNVRFHDLRHMAVTNLRRAGVDALTAMKITGHKTMAAFRRYHTIDDHDLAEAQRQMDTYLDTTALAAYHTQMEGPASTGEIMPDLRR
jgi:integrase